jgi:hypothetical protein
MAMGLVANPQTVGLPGIMPKSFTARADGAYHVASYFVNVVPNTEPEALVVGRVTNVANEQQFLKNLQKRAADDTAPHAPVAVPFISLARVSAITKAKQRAIFGMRPENKEEEGDSDVEEENEGGDVDDEIEEVSRRTRELADTRRAQAALAVASSSSSSAFVFAPAPPSSSASGRKSGKAEASDSDTERDDNGYIVEDETESSDDNEPDYKKRHSSKGQRAQIRAARKQRCMAEVAEQPAAKKRKKAAPLSRIRAERLREAQSGQLTGRACDMTGNLVNGDGRSKGKTKASGTNGEATAERSFANGPEDGSSLSLSIMAALPLSPEHTPPSTIGAMDGGVKWLDFHYIEQPTDKPKWLAHFNAKKAGGSHIHAMDFVIDQNGYPTEVRICACVEGKEHLAEGHTTCTFDIDALRLKYSNAPFLASVGALEKHIVEGKGSLTAAMRASAVALPFHGKISMRLPEPAFEINARCIRRACTTDQVDAQRAEVAWTSHLWAAMSRTVNTPNVSTPPQLLFRSPSPRTLRDITMEMAQSPRMSPTPRQLDMDASISTNINASLANDKTWGVHRFVRARGIADDEYHDLDMAMLSKQALRDGVAYYDLITPAMLARGDVTATRDRVSGAWAIMCENTVMYGWADGRVRVTTIHARIATTRATKGTDTAPPTALKQVACDINGEVLVVALCVRKAAISDLETVFGTSAKKSKVASKKKNAKPKAKKGKAKGKKKPKKTKKKAYEDDGTTTEEEEQEQEEEAEEKEEEVKEEEDAVVAMEVEPAADSKHGSKRKVHPEEGPVSTGVIDTERKVRYRIELRWFHRSGVEFRHVNSAGDNNGVRNFLLRGVYLLPNSRVFLMTLHAVFACEMPLRLAEGDMRAHTDPNPARSIFEVVEGRQLVESTDPGTMLILVDATKRRTAISRRLLLTDEADATVDAQTWSILSYEDTENSGHGHANIVASIAARVAQARREHPTRWEPLAIDFVKVMPDADKVQAIAAELFNPAGGLLCCAEGGVVGIAMHPVVLAYDGGAAMEETWDVASSVFAAVLYVGLGTMAGLDKKSPAATLEYLMTGGEKTNVGSNPFDIMSFFAHPERKAPNGDPWFRALMQWIVERLVAAAPLLCADDLLDQFPNLAADKDDALLCSAPMFEVHSTANVVVRLVDGELAALGGYLTSETKTTLRQWEAFVVKFRKWARFGYTQRTEDDFLHVTMDDVRCIAMGCFGENACYQRLARLHQRVAAFWRPHVLVHTFDARFVYRTLRKRSMSKLRALAVTPLSKTQRTSFHTMYTFLRAGRLDAAFGHFALSAGPLVQSAIGDQEDADNEDEPDLVIDDAALPLLFRRCLWLVPEAVPMPVPSAAERAVARTKRYRLDSDLLIEANLLHVEALRVHLNGCSLHTPLVALHDHITYDVADGLRRAALPKQLAVPTASKTAKRLGGGNEPPAPVSLSSSSSMINVRMRMSTDEIEQIANSNASLFLKNKVTATASSPPPFTPPPRKRKVVAPAPAPAPAPKTEPAVVYVAPVPTSPPRAKPLSMPLAPPPVVAPVSTAPPLPSTPFAKRKDHDMVAHVFNQLRGEFAPLAEYIVGYLETIDKQPLAVDSDSLLVCHQRCRDVFRTFLYLVPLLLTSVRARWLRFENAPIPCAATPSDVMTKDIATIRKILTADGQHGSLAALLRCNSTASLHKFTGDIYDQARSWDAACFDEVAADVGIDVDRADFDKLAASSSFGGVGAVGAVMARFCIDYAPTQVMRDRIASLFHLPMIRILAAPRDDDCDNGDNAADVHTFTSDPLPDLFHLDDARSTSFVPVFDEFHMEEEKKEVAAAAVVTTPGEASVLRRCIIDLLAQIIHTKTNGLADLTPFISNVARQLYSTTNTPLHVSFARDNGMKLAASLYDAASTVPAPKDGKISTYAFHLADKLARGDALGAHSLFMFNVLEEYKHDLNGEAAMRD